MAATGKRLFDEFDPDTAGDAGFQNIRSGQADVSQAYNYEVVPVTTQTTLGATGAAGDLLHKVLATDATTAVVIKDAAVTVYTWTREALTAGVSAPAVELELNLLSVSGAWSLTCTGAGATGIGKFT